MMLVFLVFGFVLFLFCFVLFCFVLFFFFLKKIFFLLHPFCKFKRKEKILFCRVSFVCVCEIHLAS